MSKVFRAVGQIAGIASMALMFVPGLQPIAFGLKAAQLGAIAGAVASVSTALAAATVKKPAAKGQVQDRLIGANHPQPYRMGRDYSGGVQVHDASWGGRVAKVDNPYRAITAVHCACGPIDSIESHQFDFAAVTFSGSAATGYYSGFLWRDQQLGLGPEPAALAAQWGGEPDWGAAYKLSGFAATKHSFLWDKKGKKFVGGAIPGFGIIAKWVRAYDPREDSTFPGGSGAQRLDDEDTWEWTANPALHAATYGYGRYQNGVRVMGVDLGDAVDFGAVAAWANVCDANAWEVNGAVYEPSTEGKWNNLKLIAQAGGAEPIWRGAILSFRWWAPRVPLDTIRRDDLADGDASSTAGLPWAARVNTLLSRYRSEAHQWNYVQGAAQSVPAFVTADGEPKREERQLDLVTDKDQAAVLDLYELYDRREAGPFVMTLKPRFILYQVNDALTLSADVGLWPTDLPVIITKRTVDPATGTVEVELTGETAAKHAAALAATGTAPPVLPIASIADREAALANNGAVLTDEDLLAIDGGAPDSVYV